MEGAGLFIIRCVQLLFVILIVALIGNVISDNIDGHMSAINYALFAAIIAWLACLLGIAATFFTVLGEGILAYVLLGLDALAVVFTFVAAIVIPAKLGDVNCNNVSVERRGVRWIGFGSNDDEKRCRELQASTAFLWFLWATLIASLLLALVNFRRSGGGSSGGSSVPHMSQVRV